MANLKFVQRKNKIRSDGTCPIMLRITANGQAGYISTKIYLLPKQWDETKQRVKKNHVSCSIYNERLRDFMRKAETYNDEDKTVQDIKAALQGNGRNDFISYANGFIDSVESEGQYWNAKNLRTALNKLIDYNGNDVIPFGKITPEYIRNFSAYLRKDLNNKTNTVNKSLQSLKRIFNQAIREKKIKRDENPFIDIKLTKEKANKEKLNDAELDRLLKLELPENSLIWHVKNYFLFSFFSGGIRFIDLAYLKWDNITDGVLRYTMSKTNKTLEFELLPPAVKILEHYEPAQSGQYIFPILPDGIENESIETQKKTLSAKNALVNKYLTKIQERAGIWQKTINEKDKDTGEIKTKVINEPRLSMHISRHSFAFYAMRNGMTLFEIQQMMGHSNAVITQDYLKSLTAEDISTSLKTAFKKYLITNDQKIIDLAK